jgi:hypothetical protein
VVVEVCMMWCIYNIHNSANGEYGVMQYTLSYLRSVVLD